MPASSPEAAAAPASAARSRRARPAGDDDEAVSEVLGFIIVLAIITAIMVLGMVAFQSAAENAHGRVVDLHGQGAADRVASLVVQAALFAETHGQQARFSYLVDLPDDLEGESYTVRLDSASRTVLVTSAEGTATAQLFQAGGSPGVTLCTPTAPASADVEGGPLRVEYGDYPLDATATPCIYLETAQ